MAKDLNLKISGPFESLYFSDFFPDKSTLTSLLFAFEKVRIYDYFELFSFYDPYWLKKNPMSLNHMIYIKFLEMK